jgi:predicted acetyltransferase
VFEIRYSRHACRTEAFALISEGWNEAVQEGYTPELVGVCPVGDHSEVVYAVSQDGDVVGVIAWDSDDSRLTFDVLLYYVEPSSRKQGVFTEMCRVMAEHAKKRGASSIFISAHPDSKPAHIAIGKLKGRPIEMRYEAIVEASLA